MDETDFHLAFCSVVRGRRHACGLSCEELAVASGVQLTDLNEIEDGRKAASPTRFHLERVRRYGFHGQDAEERREGALTLGRDAASPNEDQALLPQRTKYRHRMSVGEIQL